MATRNLGQFVTALELSRHIHEGALVPLIQSLSKEIQMFGDANMEVANDGSGHIGTTENSQPTGNYYGYNEGIATEASTSAEFREPLIMLGSRFQAHKKLLIKQARGDMQLAGAIRARMIGQSMAGMLKNHMTQILYGSRLTGKSPLGIFTRTDSNNLASAFVHDNARGNASATANKTSALLIGWGPLKYTWIFPEGEAPASGNIAQPGSPLTGVGITVEALPDDWVEDVDADSTKKFMAVRNELGLDTSHAIMDARYVQRQCNISTSNIDGDDDISFDESILIEMLHAMPDRENAILYVNKTLGAQIDNRANIKGNVFHMKDDPFGNYVPHVREVPIHINEQIVDTEATVT
ncbi:hypothetical protein LCGC14_2184650 [marine sediment metagenome]|uniref:Major capsid protein n=1 Tax=marine sediment metagenome TaxID=412755 RepID=A0A0F9DL91_9ZZZZ